MLSKVSIKDHLHHEAIVDLAKEIHAGEPKHLRKGKNARDYLMQAKAMFEATQSSTSSSSHPTRPKAKTLILTGDKPKVTFTQTVKAGCTRGTAIFPPKLPPTHIPVDPKPKESWQTVQRKKATCQGTKTTMVSGIIPAMHQIP